MKKLTYLFVAAAALGMVACGGNKPGYVITGTVEGAADGDTVFLQEVVGRQLSKLDTAIIKNGTFTFEGVQDSAVNRYITSGTGNEAMLMDFFLENGKINIALTKNNDSATGTANNDAYQEIRNKINALNQNELGEVYKEGIEKNITNPVGIHLFKMNYYSMETAENDALLQQIPAQFQNDAAIVKIKEMVEKQKKTAVGQKFIDFEMQTPDGKSVKLSDYAGKGKVVLVDFWASWCGPCRREMPNLVEAYAKYKGKNFEIVGVSLDQNADSWKEAIKTLKMTWPQMSDLKYWNSEGAQLYAVNSIPHTMLIDGEGTIIARGLHGEELQTKIAEALKK